MLVVGGGSAGCVVASRLIQADLSVALVEAGPDYGPLNSGRWPPELLDPRSPLRSHDWGYVQELPGRRTLTESRAKVVGGCSAHNQCAAIWGLPDDYNKWADAGNLGWSYMEIVPLIDKIEKATSGSATLYRGRNGAVPTRPYSDDELASWQRFFLESAINVGFPRVVDLSAPEPSEGVASFHANVKDHVRWNAAFAFLDRIRESPNLTILSNTVVDKVMIHEGKATTIVCNSGNDVLEFVARRFVLSGGAYGSPMILMRSGIGPAKHLESLGIRPMLDLPGIGQNLHDHPGIGVQFEPSRIARQALEEDRATGRLYQSQVILKAKSAYCEASFDLHILPYQTQEDSGEWSFEILVFNMTPKSRGRVQLRGRGADLPPWIDFQFLTDSRNRDIAVLNDGLNIAHRLPLSEPLAGAIVRATEPRQLSSKQSDLYSYIRDNVFDYAHPVGTCKMGLSSDPTSVVDESGRVHGISNLFVADASIMPQIPRVNTNLTCFLIGLRVANMLLSLAA